MVPSARGLDNAITFGSWQVGAIAPPIDSVRDRPISGLLSMTVRVAFVLLGIDYLEYGSSLVLESPNRSQVYV